jgi:hypothetical protein
MRYFIFFLMIILFTACKKQPIINCEGKQPMWKTCDNGTYRCMENKVEVPGMPESYGCVPKGMYEYICHEPCPPYTKLLMANRSGSGIFVNDVNGFKSLNMSIMSDVNVANMQRGDWAPSENETFWVKPLPNKQGYSLEMFYLDTYRIWDESKQDYSKSSMVGRMTESMDSIYMTIHYGWDKEADFKENRCDLVFVKSNL